LSLLLLLLLLHRSDAPWSLDAQESAPKIPSGVGEGQVPRYRGASPSAGEI
jgi:hypothetical protein